MTRARAWLLALVLLWAQFVAGVHALEHLHDADDPDHPPCEWCLAFHAVQHGATGKPSIPPVAGRPVVQPERTPHGVRAPYKSHYRSRAPPLILA